LNSTKTLLILGFAFLACGATFLIVGLTTHLVPFLTLGPACIVLGIVFLSTSRSRKPANEPLARTRPD
jgi:hypothetical protein